MNIKKSLPGIKKNILLKNYTTFKIGGPAKYFFVARTKEDLIEAVMVARKFKLPFFILGSGSNILVSDKGINGLVIKIQNAKIKMPARQSLRLRPMAGGQNENSKYKIICEAGASLASVVSEATKKSLTGMEWAAGIPGAAGGTIYENAGAFGRSMKDIVKKIEVFDTKTGKSKILKAKDCKFGYRDSIFKKKKNLIILSAVFQLKKGKKKEIEKEIQENLKSRAKKQPLNFSSAGSVFKNPSPAQISPKFVAGKGFSAGELIENCGLKGKKIGNVKISEKHANFIVNLNRGRAKDVKKLINLAKKKVKNKFGIVLEEEIELLGF